MNKLLAILLVALVAPCLFFSTSMEAPELVQTDAVTSYWCDRIKIQVDTEGGHE